MNYRVATRKGAACQRAEDLLNGELARLLREHGIAAETEVRERGKRMDMVADIDGVRAVLEAGTGYPASADLAGRLNRRRRRRRGRRS